MGERAERTDDDLRREFSDKQLPVRADMVEADSVCHAR